MATKTHPTWEHIKNHATAYITTAVLGGAGLVFYLGGQTVLDGRYIVREVHADEHESFEDLYRQTEAQKRVDLVRKELRQTRRELRRAEAYLTADPDSPLVNARQQSVNELKDEIEELEDEFDLAKKAMNGDSD